MVASIDPGGSTDRPRRRLLQRRRARSLSCSGWVASHGTARVEPPPTSRTLIPRT